MGHALIMAKPLSIQFAQCCIRKRVELHSIRCIQDRYSGRTCCFLCRYAWPSSLQAGVSRVSVIDLIVLVVAADDAILMPQTIESIVHARYVDVPIIVAAEHHKQGS